MTTTAHRKNYLIRLPNFSERYGSGCSFNTNLQCLTGPVQHQVGHQQRPALPVQHGVQEDQRQTHQVSIGAGDAGCAAEATHHLLHGQTRALSRKIAKENITLSAHLQGQERRTHLQPRRQFDNTIDNTWPHQPSLLTSATRPLRRKRGSWQCPGTFPPSWRCPCPPRERDNTRR